MKLRPPAGLQNFAISLPTSLPFERQIDQALNNVAAKIEGNPITTKLMQIHAQLPVVEEVDLNTPLGRIRLPEISAPAPMPPALNSRRKEAMKAAIGSDISSVVGVIPVVGDVVSDVVEDVFGEKIRNSLNKAELDRYMKYDKMGPSTLAMARAFTKR